MISMRRFKRLRCLKGQLVADGAPTARQEEYGDAVHMAAVDVFSVSLRSTRVLSPLFRGTKGRDANGLRSRMSISRVSRGGEASEKRH